MTNPQDSSDKYDELIVLPSLMARPVSEGRLLLTNKYLTGMAEYAAFWPGRVTSLVKITQRPSNEMDQISILPSESYPSVEIRPQDHQALESRLRDAAVVLAGLTGDELELAKLCFRQSIPLVFISEYTINTQKQIIDANTKNFLLRVRRKVWARRDHKRAMEALELATSLQCSGTPTYREYAYQKLNTLLFFDNRVSQHDVISIEDFATKLEAVGVGRPLRLVFGGRLVPMKGVLELPKVAAELVRRGLRFTLEIVGSGPLEQSIIQSIVQLGLEDVVKLRPPMDFRSGWLPYLRRHVDLFVCCHVQGDPSSTYPEVMSCGVPIVGYDNEAFSGIVELSNGAWSTHPSPAILAAQIVLLDDRDALQKLATNARKFALGHTFEPTFLRRVEHMVESSRLNPTAKSKWLALHGQRAN